MAKAQKVNPQEKEKEEKDIFNPLPKLEKKSTNPPGAKKEKKVPRKHGPQHRRRGLLEPQGQDPGTDGDTNQALPTASAGADPGIGGKVPAKRAKFARER
jgi:hypothetical protein